MNKPTKQMKDKPAKSMEGKPAKPRNRPNNLKSRNKQRGFGVVELLFAAATIGAAVLVAAMTASKNPPLHGE